MATIKSDREIPRGLTLRPADAAECLANGFEPEEAVRDSARRSDDYFCVSVDGSLAACWGYSGGSLFSHRAQAWLLTTPEADKHSMRLGRSSIRVMRYLFERFQEVEVVTHEDHVVALNWLRWLGFKPEGYNKHFYTLVAKKEDFPWGN